ncbi:hypothetical protein ACFYP4_02700 [Streptomyces sp. NPDC005551]|uniref:hypothetical protein n=1 Tax=Streptomyces sp. NPDC005551 TaxID=3364725 RepID=UPI0036B66CFF
MPTDITIAFGGHAANARPNVEALLSDWLRLGSPDREGYYDKPDRWGKITFYALLADGVVPDGLKHAMRMASSIGDLDDGVAFEIVTDTVTADVEKWAEAADKVHEVEDPFKHLVALLGEASRPYLFINWDEEDADDEELIKLCHENPDIRVSDLVNGLGQIVPDARDEEEPQDEPEEEEPEEKPARRSGKSRSRAVEELEAPEEELDETPAKAQASTVKASEAAPQSLEEDVAAAKRAEPAQSTLAVGEITVDSNRLRDVLVAISRTTFYLQSQDTANAARALTEVVFSPLTVDLVAAEETLAGLLEGETKYDEVVKATAKPAKGKPALEAGKKVIWDEDGGTWKPAPRGRKRSGTRVGIVQDDGSVLEEAA